MHKDSFFSNYRLIIFCLYISGLSLVFSGCSKVAPDSGNSSKNTSASVSGTDSAASDSVSTSSDSPSSSHTSDTVADTHADTNTKTSDSKAKKSHIPKVLVPEASGSVTYGNQVVVIDASHSSDGYLMVNYTGSNPKVKLQLSRPDALTYTYDLHGGYEVFPLTGGDGDYALTIYENVKADQYSTAFSLVIQVTISNTFGPYLYPNQYVNFNSDSKTVAMSETVAKGADDDLGIVSNVYNYIINHFSYDYDKASNVQSGYLPDVDAILGSHTGICFDYAAVMATMLRVQGIPTRMEIGYCGDVYHAWISVYTKETGWINGIIAFDGKDWRLMDPTFASTSQSPKDFTATDNSYTAKYVY